MVEQVVAGIVVVVVVGVAGWAARRARKRLDARRIRTGAKDRHGWLEQLRECREYMSANLEMMIALAEGDITRGLRIAKSVEGREASDPILVGDMAAVRAWVDACSALFDAVPDNRAVRAIWMALPARIRNLDADRPREALRLLNRALDEQERMVLSGRAPHLLDREDVQAAIDLQGRLESHANLLGQLEGVPREKRDH